MEPYNQPVVIDNVSGFFLQVETHFITLTSHANVVVVLL